MSKIELLRAQMPDQHAQLEQVVLNEFEKQLAGCQDEVRFDVTLYFMDDICSIGLCCF